MQADLISEFRGTGERCATDGRRELRVLYPNRPLAVREALETTMKGLRGFGIGECDRMNIELTLAEILNNVAEHAYADDTGGMVELSVVMDAGRIQAEVVDSGKPMPEGILPDPSLPEADIDDPPEGGFGWFIIKSLTESLTYTRENGRNRLRATLKLDHTLRPA